MRRRTFVALAGGALPAAAILPQRSAAQAALPIIGFLGFTGPAPDQVVLFLQGLAEAGFSDGRNVTVRYRWANNQSDRLPVLAAELLSDPKPALIVTIGGLAAALAAKAVTTTLPVVFEVGRDPVGAGLVSSLNRPGGNATGVYMLTGALNAKRLQLLHEMVPRAKTIAILVNPNDRRVRTIEDEVRSAATTLGVESVVVGASTEREIEAAFAILAAKRVGALIVGNNPFFNAQREQLVALTLRHELPAIFEWRDFTAKGGLMSYGTDLAGALRQLGVYAGAILKGAKPADLPVVQSTRFELVINRGTARALGLPIPPALLAGADEVID